MIRNDASQRQVEAADPQKSTWVAANAGSGKTRVLTDRVARLLLEKVDPQNILCLTYTKAAATEMQNRLFKRLGGWAMKDGKALRHELRELGYVPDITTETLDDARTLFARAIETPGGLKIQTIHSFCSSLLRRFPLEAGVSPQFREMEDQTAKLLRRDVLDDLSSGPHSNATRSFFGAYTGNDLDALLNEIAGQRDAFTSLPPPNVLQSAFGVADGTSMRDLVGSVLSMPHCRLLHDLIPILASGTSTEAKAAAKLARVDLSNPTETDLQILEGVFLTGPGAKTPFAAKIGSFPTKGTRQAHPDLVDDLDSLMEQVEEIRETRLSLSALARTQILYEFAVPFVQAYEARKTALGLLDFDDLIIKTERLLSDPAVAQWVLFRLDGGIDHVLVDEAQDTAPRQWSVVEHLTQEFATGIGAQEDKIRTVFVVGDKQQSIYSFQGADPDAFDRMQHHFSERLSGVGETLQRVDLSHSFRSSQAILDVVDMTFDQSDRARAIGKVQFHKAFKTKMPGRVDLWPLIEADKSKDEPPHWSDPVDQIGEAHHLSQLAERIARQIDYIIEHETLPQEIDKSGEFNHRRVTAGDILILVQRRSDLFHEIIAACKRHDLPVAGADRLRVGAELAVKDLTNLLRFLALPEDDLSLACALRSPLLLWSEQDIYTLAHHRKETYLWAALRDSNHTKTLAILEDLRSDADFLRPYDLIERILTRHDGRRNLLARLGSEAEDGIDALLQQALSYEQTEVPSLTGFLNWMESEELEIKRQMDSQGDKIRVMTVHGSKGLEAPIVILPDTAKRKTDLRADILKSGDIALWKTRADASPANIADLKRAALVKQEEERLRLLYVAMTRAESWLITAAAGDVDDASWYSIVADGMQKRGEEDVAFNDLMIKRVSVGNWKSGTKTTVTLPDISEASAPAFSAVTTPQVEPPLLPSDLGGAKVVANDQSEGDPDALSRGTLIHLLLEHLPNYPPTERKAIARGLLDREQELDIDQDELIEHVEQVLNTPTLSHIFTEDALTEVNVSALLPNLSREIFGTIDRLLIEPTRVLAIDYKSNRIVPDQLEDVPEGLLRQMGAYAAALALIYPDRTIETAILWTETTTLMNLSASSVSDALARVTVS